MQDHRRPQWVYGVGEEPDYRFSLANERTFLAWVRTALGLLGGGVAVEAFGVASPHLRSVLAVTLGGARGGLRRGRFAAMGTHRTRPARAHTAAGRRAGLADLRGGARRRRGHPRGHLTTGAITSHYVEICLWSAMFGRLPGLVHEGAESWQRLSGDPPSPPLWWRRSAPPPCRHPRRRSPHARREPVLTSTPSSRRSRSAPRRTGPPTARLVGEISEAIVGANQRWPDDGKGVWDSVTHQPAANVVRLSKEAGLDMLRYPGGTVANTFDFAKAIGPLDQRGCQTSGGFANGRFAATDSRFGPDENEQMAKAIGGESMTMVSAVNSSAAHAADYVEYMNSPADGNLSNPHGGTDWAEVRAANGHAKPVRRSTTGSSATSRSCWASTTGGPPTQRPGCSSSSTAAGSGRPHRTRRTRTTTGCSSAATWPPGGPARGSPARATGSASRPSRSPATRSVRPASVTGPWPSPS